VKNKCRASQFSSLGSDIGSPDGFNDPPPVGWRRRQADMFIEQAKLVSGAIRYEHRRKELPKCRIFVGPAEFYRFELRRRRLSEFDVRSRRKRTIGSAAMDDETIDPVWKARGVGDSGHCTARKAKEIEAIEAGGLCNSLEIVDKSLEGEFDSVAIRQATPALIEPNQRMLPS
jgi:hypothetical protein